MSRRGKLLVVSGPSGVGKSSVIDGVLGCCTSRFSVSATTRAPRTGEVDGREYHFVDREAFADLIQSGGMLEWAEYGGHFYGTPRAPVVDLLERGVHVVLDIENDGAHQVKAAYSEAVLVFVLPPSRAELERRLRGRGDTAGADIERRLAVADEQIADAFGFYDHLVVNDDIETAISRIVSILQDPKTPNEGSDASPAPPDAAATRSDTE
ncbi:MAG: guanylate kinase [Actinomycetota bacterium]